MSFPQQCFREFFFILGPEDMNSQMLKCCILNTHKLKLLTGKGVDSFEYDFVLYRIFYV